ncbi:MAG: hypothetical protein WD069_17220 [Planctomycetales bacterium]
MFKQTTTGAALIAVGLAAGLGIAHFRPSEPLRADAVDRGSKFSLMTTPVSFTEGTEGVFAVDYLTGQLKGAVINTKVGRFTNFYYRNLAADFNVDPKVQPHYAVVGGRGQLTGTGGITSATSLIYVSELTSGKVVAYGMPFRESVQPLPPAELTPIAEFQFRQAVQP